MKTVILTFLLLIFHIPYSFSQCGLDRDCVAKLDSVSAIEWFKAEVDLAYQSREESFYSAKDRLSGVIKILVEINPPHSKYESYRAYLQNGYNHIQTIELQTAIDSYEKARKIFLGTDACDGKSISRCLYDICSPKLTKDVWYNLYRPLATLYKELGFYKAAKEYIFSDVLNEKACWGDYLYAYGDMLEIEGQIALMEGTREDTIRAGELFKKANSIVLPEGETQLKIKLSLANSFRILGKFRKSDSLLKRLAIEIPNLGDPGSRKSLLRDMNLFRGYLYRDSSRSKGGKAKKEIYLNEAQQAYNRALVYDGGNNPTYIFQALGDIETMKGYQNKAILNYKKILYHLFPDQEKEISNGNLPELDSLNPKFKALGALEGLAFCSFQKYQQDSVKKDLEYAYSIYHKIYELENDLRSSYFLEENRLLFAKNSRRRLNRAMDMAYAYWEQNPGKNIERFIWNINERVRALELKGALEVAELWDSLEIVDPLVKEIIQTENLLNLTSDPNRNNSNKYLDSLKKRNYALRNSLFQDRPELERRKTGTTSINLKEIDKYLDNSNCLVAYFFSEKYIYTISKYKDEFKLIRNSKAKIPGLIRKVEKFVLASKEPQSLNARKAYQTDAYNLYEYLLGPVKNWNTKNLILIPDSSLLFFPFDALLTEDAQLRLYKDYPFTWKKYTFQYSFSVSLLLEEKRPAKVFQYDYLGFAPHYPEKYQAKYGPELKNNRREIMEAYNHIRSGGIRAKLYLDTLATRENFLASIIDGQLVHLSMHADLPSGNTDYRFAYLQFQPRKYTESSLASEHRVYLHEIYNSRILANLVLLSACYSGKGDLYGQEGVMSIGRAFKYAGAQNILMSLWEVEDNFSGVFTPLYMKFLSDGYGKAESLKMAKQDIMDQKNTWVNDEKQAPFYWAGIVLYGDNSNIIGHQNRNRQLKCIIIIIISFIILYFALSKIRQKS